MIKRLSIRSVRPVKQVEILRGGDDEVVESPVFEELALLPVETVVEEPMIRVSDARKQVQNGYDRGFADGKQVATATMLVEVQRQYEVLKNFDTLLDNLHGEFTKSFGIMEHTAVELALIAAEAVIGEEVRRDKSTVTAQVKKSLEALRGADNITIRLNTDDYDALAQAKSAYIDDPIKAAKVKIIADDSVELGGCIAESSLGSIDAQIRTQFQKIAKAFMSNIEKISADY